MATIVSATTPARARRNRRVIIAAAGLGLMLAAFAPRNQRALFVTDAGPEAPAAFFAEPGGQVGHSGFGPALLRRLVAPARRAAPIRPGGLTIPLDEPLPARQTLTFGTNPALPTPTAFSAQHVPPPPGYPISLPPGPVPVIGPPPTAGGPGIGGSTSSGGSSSGGTTPGGGITPPVPEPSTWMMMIGGLMLTGAALRRAPRREPCRA